MKVSSFTSNHHIIPPDIWFELQYSQLSGPLEYSLVHLMKIGQPELFWSRLRDFFIGPESDHWQCLSVTDSLTHWLTDSLPFSKLESDHRLPLSLTHWLTDGLVNFVAILDWKRGNLSTAGKDCLNLNRRSCRRWRKMPALTSDSSKGNAKLNSSADPPWNAIPEICLILSIKTCYLIQAPDITLSLTSYSLVMSSTTWQPAPASKSFLFRLQALRSGWGPQATCRGFLLA